MDWPPNPKPAIYFIHPCQLRMDELLKDEILQAEVEI
jgi:hypothetical protein